jgi:glucose-6-phosphate dehydrogenase assembly protein OpcA
MGLKEIIEGGPHMTLQEMQQLQAEYDRRFLPDKFKQGDAKVAHTYAHMGKLMGRLADYVEAMEEGRPISPEEIRTKVIPDLLVYCGWLANEFEVDIEQAFLARVVGNIKRIYSDKTSPEELRAIEEAFDRKVRVHE